MNKRVLQIYVAHALRYPWSVTALLFVIVAAQALHLLVPWLYKRFFDLLFSGATPAVLAPQLIQILFSVFFLTLGGWFLWRASGFLTAVLHPKITKDLYETAFRYLLHHSYRFFANHFGGSLVRKVGRFTHAFHNLADQLQWKLIPITVTTIGVFIALFLRHPTLAWILFGWLVVFILMNAVISNWKLRYDKERSAIDSEVTGALADALTNSITVKTFAGYTYEERLFQNILERFRRIWKFCWNLAEINMAVQTFLMILLELGMMWMAVSLWTKGLLTAGDFALLQAYLIRIIDTMWDLGHVFRDIYEQVADASEMAEIIDTTPEVGDKPRAKALAVRHGEIQFDHVVFSYRKTRPILNDLDLTIKAGEKVALVGPSGAGKSTVTKLMFRFFDLDAGAIRIDGQSVADVTLESLWEHIGLVPQEPILFHRTLMENIRYGRRTATDEEVVQAAKKARCHEFIVALPNGYGTFVGERGVKLSGGERQRVAIARAILKDAPILVLDEATSSLDSESEAMIQEALRALMKGKTTMVIAHRLSTIMQMDRIVVMEGGKMADEGTHAELLKRHGTYKKLWEIQAGGFVH